MACRSACARLPRAFAPSFSHQHNVRLCCGTRLIRAAYRSRTYARSSAVTHHNARMNMRSMARGNDHGTRGNGSDEHDDHRTDKS